MSPLKKIGFFILVVHGVAVVTAAGQRESVKIPMTKTPPVIDGHMEDPAWKEAVLFTDFKTMKPDYGLPPSEKTEGFLVYDRDNLYIGFRCYDCDPAKIKATVSKRDNAGIGNDDWVAFALDAANDQLNAFLFLANPFGIQADGTLNSEADPDITLDMVWKSAGRLTPEGYIVEMAVPFKSLRFPSRKSVIMGFKFARNISRKSEEVDFPEYSPAKGAALAQFQSIEFSEIQGTEIQEALPAVTASRSRPFQGPSMGRVPWNADFGLTLKYGITSDLVLDGAYRPDFSQVETDAGQVDINLRYSLFYPEKRPFFAEGPDPFKFAATPDDMPLVDVVHTRNIADLILGFKLTGKIGESDKISALYAQDEYPIREAADQGDAAGAKHNAHFGVFRYIRNLKNDGYLGGFYTGRGWAGTSNHVIGADGRLRISNVSVLEFHGFRSFSMDRNVSEGAAGHALGAFYIYSSRRFEAQVGLFDISKNFRTDVGYLDRTGVTIIPLYAQTTFYLTSGWLQKVEPYYWGRQIRDAYSGLWETFNVFSIRCTMPRQTEINLQGWIANEVFASRRFSRNAVRLEAETQIWKELYLECDLRRGDLIYYDSAVPYQGQGTRLSVGLLFQPTESLSSGLDITYSDFFRKTDNLKVYAYSILRNKTVVQVNPYLFFRGIVEYNTYWKRINADFLASFTYIPGTVVYFGYGSVYEKSRWQEGDLQFVPADSYFLQRDSFFFKASYLWRF